MQMIAKQQPVACRQAGAILGACPAGAEANAGTGRMNIAVLRVRGPPGLLVNVKGGVKIEGGFVVRWWLKMRLLLWN